VATVFDQVGRLFVYRSPKPMKGERLRRFVLQGKSSKELQRILGKNLHIKKTVLINMILEKTQKIPGWGLVDKR
jgi:hypothetical protein